MFRPIAAICIALFATAATTPARAVDYERILLPILIKPFDGAFGTSWRVDAQMLIDSEGRVDMFPLVDCVFCIERMPRGSAFQPPLFFQQPNHPPGSLLYVERSVADDVRISVRLRETTRGSASGLEMPVVREGEFFTDTIHLLDIPIRPGWRVTLRIYDLEARGGAAARIRFFSSAETTAALSLEAPFVLSPANNPNFALNVTPAYIQVSGVEENFPQLTGLDRIRIEIDPLTPGLTLWAFVSITDDLTQQVSLITP